MGFNRAQNGDRKLDAWFENTHVREERLVEIPGLRFARFPEAVWPATYQPNKENARTISLFFGSFAPGCAHLRSLRHILILILSIFSLKPH